MTFDAPINVTDASFDRAVLESSRPVVAVFWSLADQSRRRLDPVLEKTAQEYAGDLLVVKLSADDAPEARARYDVETLPEFLFFRRGKLVARAKGTPSAKALRPWLEYLLQRGPKPTTAKKRPDAQPVGDGKPVTVTDATFEQVVLGADRPVLVDFWASWCGPCRAVAPTVEQIARDYAGRALVAKVDIDANQVTARRYRVMSVPTLAFFKDGREVDRVSGVQPPHVLQQRLETLLKP